MKELLNIGGLAVLLFVLSFAVSYLVNQLRRSGMPSAKVPAPETPVRFRGDSGVYRCYFVQATKAGWMFSAPLQRDVHVPLRVGEKVVVEIPAKHGVMVYRSEIVGRSNAGKNLVLRAPTQAHTVERRCEPRDSSCKGTIIEVNGDIAELINASKGGVRVKTCVALHVGDRVRVTMPGSRQPQQGYVLDSKPEAWHGLSCRDVRICIDLVGERVDLHKAGKALVW